MSDFVPRPVDPSPFTRAVDALLADSGLPRFGGHRATVERRQRIAWEAAGIPLEVPADWRGEVCERCARHSVVGFTVPDPMWALVIGDRYRIVCLSCFDALAAPKLVQWDNVVELHPVSTETWRHGETPRQACSYCREEFPAPVELHHDEDECLANRARDETPEFRRIRARVRFAISQTAWGDLRHDNDFVADLATRVVLEEVEGGTGVPPAGS